MSRRTTAQLAVVVPMALLLAACGGNGTVAATSSSADLTIKAKDKLRFEPNTLVAKVGQAVTVVIENVGRTEHSFVIDALHVDSGGIPGGQQGMVNFSAERPGNYTFYSSQPGERTGGMVGTLTVSE
jgi:uncharacterized cupredoxin-like copper-binding protein